LNDTNRSLKKTTWFLSREIKRIELKTFNGLVELKLVDLSRNELRTIDEQTFNTLRLNVSHLDYIQLGTLHPRALSELKTMETLHLNNYQLVELDSEIFYGWDSLLNIYLEHNQIEKISLQLFGHLQNLEYDRNIICDHLWPNRPNANSTFDGLKNLVECWCQTLSVHWKVWKDSIYTPTNGNSVFAISILFTILLIILSCSPALVQLAKLSRLEFC
jgi:hypothetical protein